MTTTQLLQPRYLVIADYPGQRYKIGDVISVYENSICHAVGSEDGRWSEKVSLEDYPALFRLLEWWEFRRADILPKYIKFNEGDRFKVIKTDQRHYNDHYLYFGYLPSTKEEYEESQETDIMCSFCNGSGENIHSNSLCWNCGGSGVVEMNTVNQKI